MSKTPPPERRSGCPLNAAVEMVGDRWSLLIVRDMLLRGSSTYAELLNGHEHIATNILADRLRKLEESGIIRVRPDPVDGRKRVYKLTPKGHDLAPVLTEMVLWASGYEKTGNQALIRQMQDKGKFLAAIRERWEQST
jgi:DNA-binding HxlR family transcriptional regulator